MNCRVLAVSLLALFVSCAQQPDTEKASAHFSRGEQLLNQNRWKEAGREFREATEHNPFHVKAHEEYQDVEFYYFEKHDEITREYQKLGEVYPDSPVFPYLLGRIAKSPSSDKSNLLKKSIQLDFTFVPAYRELCKNSWAGHEYDDAYAILDTALRRCPDSVDLLSEKALCLYRGGRTAEAAQTWLYVTEHYPDSSQSAWALFELANLTGDPGEKMRYLETALTTETSNTMFPAYDMLLRLYEEYDSTKVVPLARKAISVFPPIRERRVPSVGYSFLFEYYLQRDTLKAIEVARELFRSKNRDPDLHTRIANDLVHMDRELPLAVKMIKKSIKLNTPENAFGLRCFGRVSHSVLKENAAQQQALFLTSLGWAYFQNGEYDKAIKTLNSALGIADWAEPEIYEALGRTYEKLEEWDSAMSAYSESLSYQENERVRNALAHLSKKVSLGEIDVGQGRSISIDSLIARAQVARTAKAPDFTLLNLDGRQVTLSSYRGKVVVLSFWASWCGPCRAELPHIQELMNSFEGNSDVIFLTISTDVSPRAARKFIQKNNFTFPVLMNRGTNVQYRVRGIPVLFMIDQHGYMRYRHEGFNPGVDFEELMSREIGMLLP